MNPFEKIFNYQILSRLEDSGTFMVTSQERSWLKTMLDHPAAADAFSPATLEKLRAILEPDAGMETPEHLLEKAKAAGKPVVHPLLRPLRRAIMRKHAICISYAIKGGRTHKDQPGLPYKLEFSMVKQEWYLLWYHRKNRSLLRTRLYSILSVSEEPIAESDADRILERIPQLLDARRTEAVIDVVPRYNGELSRILYALSCFDKEVTYDEGQDTYSVRLLVPGDEQEYLLSKLRFLGRRVRIREGAYLRRRMLESSTKALERYGIVSACKEEVPKG
ncbi:WYL domain-containing protein [Paenibacillus sp. FSL W8-0919]|uniref:WYL domain-containing protein n=1 Tax=Paenibacillus sp. FSL W8-0919 TaxID=2954707 RepID=UPI0030FB8A63